MITYVLCITISLYIYNCRNSRLQSNTVVHRKSTPIIKKTDLALELVFNEDNQLTVKVVKTTG